MIPLIFFLFIYGLLALLVILLSLVNFYHLLKYSHNRARVFLIVYLYIIIFVLNVFFTGVFLRGVNWQTAILPLTNESIIDFTAL